MIALSGADRPHAFAIFPKASKPSIASSQSVVAVCNDAEGGNLAHHGDISRSAL
jgi:hypothetical protein